MWYFFVPILKAHGDRVVIILRIITAIINLLSDAPLSQLIAQVVRTTDRILSDTAVDAEFRVAFQLLLLLQSLN